MLLKKSKASLSRKVKTHSLQSLHNQLHRFIHPRDFAEEYPIQWLEEVTHDGALTKGPGHGDRAIWMNSDASIAWGLEMSSVDPYHANESYIEGLRATVAGVYAMLQWDERVQFLWTPWEAGSEMYERFGTCQEGEPAFLRWWRTTLAARDRKRMMAGELKNYRSFMFWNMEPAEGEFLADPTEQWDASLGRKMADLGKILPQYLKGYTRPQYEAFILKAVKRQNAISSNLSIGGDLRIDPVRAETLLDLLTKSWAPELWDRKVKGFPIPGRSNPMGNQAPFPSYFVKGLIEDGGFFVKVKDVYHVVLTHDTLPQESDIGLVPHALTFEEMHRSISNIEVMLTLIPTSQSKEMQHLKWRIKQLAGQMKAGDEFLDNQEIINQYVARLKELRIATKPQMFDGHVQLHLWNSDLGKLEEDVANAKNTLATRMEYSFEEEELNTLPYLVHFGQPGFSRSTDLDRCISVVASEAAALSPLAVGPTGVINPDSPIIPMMFETDIGMPYPLDIFADQRLLSYGGMGIGPTGTGKSNLFQRIALAHGHGGVDIIILDGANQPSFKPICNLLGGAFYDASSNLGYNPMSTSLDDQGNAKTPTTEEMTDIEISLITMIYGQRPMDPRERSLLQKAIRDTFENRESSQVILDNLLKHLRPDKFSNADDIRTATDFNRILKETWVQKYGHKFNCQNRFNPKWLTVFQVNHLFDPGNEQLQPVEIGMLFRFILQTALKNKTRTVKRPLLIYCDEAWKALLNKLMVSLITNLFRAGRALVAAPFLLTQSMEDASNLIRITSEGESAGNYASSPLLDNSAHLFFFAMGKDDAKLAGEKFGFNEKQIKTLSELGGVKGEFREFVHSCKLSDGKPRTFTRLKSRILGPEKWATTTDGKEDGRRTEFHSKITHQIATQAGSRARWGNILREAGYPLVDKTPDNELIWCATIHALNHNLSV